MARDLYPFEVPFRNRQISKSSVPQWVILAQIERGQWTFQAARFSYKFDPNNSRYDRIEIITRINRSHRMRSIGPVFAKFGHHWIELWTTFAKVWHRPNARNFDLDDIWFDCKKVCVLNNGLRRPHTTWRQIQFAKSFVYYFLGSPLFHFSFFHPFKTHVFGCVHVLSTACQESFLLWHIEVSWHSNLLPPL